MFPNSVNLGGCIRMTFLNAALVIAQHKTDSKSFLLMMKHLKTIPDLMKNWRR